jgi:hypothetical protein
MAGMFQIRAVGLLCWVAFACAGCKLFGDSDVPEEKSCVADVNTAKQAQFEVNSELQQRLRATLVGTAQLEQTANKLDDEMASLCFSLARELGERGEPDNTKPAGERSVVNCELAVKYIREAREKAGTTLVIETQEPLCAARVSDYQSCAKACDGNLPPETEVGCAENALSGRCAGKCAGQCMENFTDDCKGECRGRCEGRCMKGFFGTCGGRCVGDCDGKAISGKCEGTCDGKCLSSATGTCSEVCEGKCAGTCLMGSKKQPCGGKCLGTCSDAMSDLQCADVLPPAEITPECRAQCDAELASRQQCGGAYAEVTVFSAADKAKGDQLKNALEKRLAMVLTIESGMDTALLRASEGLKAALSALSETAEGEQGVKSKIGSCLAAAEVKQQKAHATFESFSKSSAELVAAIRH